jgi:ribosomal protein L44E
MSAHQPGTIALDLTCAECGRSPRPSETLRVVFIDIGEAATYCPECAEREFGKDD